MEPNLPTPLGIGIAEVEAATGLNKDTLRVWERRYGFPTPERDAHGDRVYDPTQVHRLQLIRRLLDAGHRPGQVVALDEPQLQAQLLQSTPAPPVPERRPDHAARTQRWLDWLKSNRPEALRQSLREEIDRLGLATAIETVLAPLSTYVGMAWHAGELTVFQEHLFTEMVQGLLREQLHGADHQNQSVHRPKILLTTLPNEQHAQGLLMAQCFMTVERCDCVPLGPNTPIAEVVSASQQLQADVVALSISAHAPPRYALGLLDLLRQRLPPSVPIWVGGQFTRLAERKWPPGIEVVDQYSDLQQRLQAWRMAHPDALGPTPADPANLSGTPS